MGRRPGRLDGKDYVDYVDWNDGYAGTVWAKWMVKALHGNGNVIYLGGPAGNPVGADQLAAIVKVFANYPGIHLLTGNKTLAGHQLGSGDGGDGHRGAARAVPEDRRDHLQLRHRRARERAGVPEGRAQARADRDARRERALVPLQEEARSRSRRSRSRNWLGRIAARKAIAAAEGLPNNEPNIYNLPSFEDTLAGKPYQCNPKAPAGLLSLQQAHAAQQITKYGQQLGSESWTVPASSCACRTSSRRSRASSRSRA